MLCFDFTPITSFSVFLIFHFYEYDVLQKFQSIRLGSNTPGPGDGTLLRAGGLHLSKVTEL